MTTLEALPSHVISEPQQRGILPHTIILFPFLHTDSLAVFVYDSQLASLFYIIILRSLHRNLNHLNLSFGM